MVLLALDSDVVVVAVVLVVVGLSRLIWMDELFTFWPVLDVEDAMVVVGMAKPNKLSHTKK